MISILKSLLDPGELVIDRVPSIKFNGNLFDCALTTQKIILYNKDRKQNLDLKLESINKISLEKEWYDEFHLGAAILLILGLIWVITGSVYRFIDDPLIAPQIGILRALLYPGIVFTSLGIIMTCIYYTRMKIHALIQTHEATYQFFSTQDTLKHIISVYNLTKSGSISTSNGISVIPDDQRLSEKALTTFEDLGAKITFRDENAQKKSINLKFRIIFTQNFMQITSNRLLLLKKSGIFEKSLKGKKIPPITEENLSSIFEIAKDLQVNWIILTNFNIALQRISLQNSHFLTGDKDLDSILLNVESSNGQFVLELKKPRLLSTAPAAEIIELEKFLKKIH